MSDIVGNIINGFVAVGTLAMAYVGFKSMKKTDHSIQATLRSAEATEKTVERMKDSLMPYLDLNILKWNNQILLSIRNVGSGLGKIYTVTVREDIQYESVYHPTNYWRHIPPPFDKDWARVSIPNYI